MRAVDGLLSCANLGQRCTMKIRYLPMKGSVYREAKYVPHEADICRERRHTTRSGYSCCKRRFGFFGRICAMKCKFVCRGSYMCLP